MSSGPRLPLAYARDLAQQFIERLGSAAAGVEIVGSIRREAPDVGDIELIAPMPARTTDDPLLDVLLSHFYNPASVASGGLFESAQRGEYWGIPDQGLKRDMRACRLVMQVLTPRHHTVKIDFNRYDPGPSGNYGWIKLMRTGDGDFAQEVLMRVNERWLGHSDQGYLRDRDGRPLRQATEEAVFGLAGLEYVNPIERSKWRAHAGATR